MQPVAASPGANKNNTKADEGGKAKESAPSSDQLVPDYAAGLVMSSPPFISVSFAHTFFPAIFDSLNSKCHIFFLLVLSGQQDESKNGSDGKQQTLPLPSKNCK